MKNLILPFFTLIMYASHAQFSIVPQVGVETFRTTIKPGNYSSISPLGQQFSPNLSVRMAYTLKSGQGAFFGVGTNSPAVNFQFTDPQNAQTSYTASAKDVQLRLEAGYQFTSKPITLRKPAFKNNYGSWYNQRNSTAKRSSCTRSMCDRKRNAARGDNKMASKKMASDKGLYMRLKPSVGVAVVPTGSTVGTEIKGARTMYTYNAGLRTALIAGTAFEFGSRNQPRFIVSVNYLKGLGNNTQTITTNEDLKSSVTSFSSKTSGFNINLGIPFSLKKKTTFVQNKQLTRPSRYSRCSRYKTYEL
jgi:hypothetical protein